MKKIISEQRLNSIISEAIKETTLRSTIRQMVMEEVNRILNLNEEGTEKKSKKNMPSDDENSKTFQSIIDGPHEEKYNVSDFGRQVLKAKYPNMSDDALRSYASKISRGERPMPTGLGAKAMQWIREK